MAGDAIQVGDTSPETAGMETPQPGEVACLWEEPTILGEGPVWVEGEQAIYWVDIVGREVLRLRLDDGSRRRWKIDEQVTSLAPRRGGGFVATLRDGFAWLDLDLDLGRSTVRPIHLPEAEIPGNRFNDGKTDGLGRFWAGSMDEGETLPSGKLYRLDPDGSLHVADTGYCITNGPAFSLDGRTAYHADTARREIYAYDVDPTGSVSDRRVFCRFEDPAWGAPDGMTVDAGGRLWVCHFGGARVTCFAPSGEALAAIHLPVPNVTSCTFGGPQLDTLYITTARFLLDAAALERYPQSGSLFACRPGVRGLPTPSFAG